MMTLLSTYTVVYRGGLPGFPKPKAGAMTLRVFDDRFELTGKRGSKFWSDLTIPFTAISDVTIADRQVNTFEAIAGGLNSLQLNQRNNIHITYTNDDGRACLIFRVWGGDGVQFRAIRSP